MSKIPKKAKHGKRHEPLGHFKANAKMEAAIN